MEIWTKKYRPKTINDIILEDNILYKLKQFMEKTNDLPNLLLYGESGIGKTLIADIITTQLSSYYTVLKLNHSFDINHTFKVINFDSHYYGKPKILFIDEFNKALNNQYYDEKTLIYTCNHLDDLGVQNVRFNDDWILEIKNPNKLKIKTLICKILDCEKIIYNESDIDIIINKFYPSISDIINNTQLYYNNLK